MAEGLANYHGWPDALKRHAIKKNPTLESRIDAALAELAREEKTEHEDRVAVQRQSDVQPDPTHRQAATEPVRAPKAVEAASPSPAWDVHRPIKQGEAIAKAVRRSLSDLAESIRAERDATENPRVVKALSEASDELDLLSLVIAGAVEDQYGSQPG